MLVSAKQYAILATILVSHAAFADSRAVEETNYQASLSLGMTDYKNSSGRVSYENISGAVTMPLAKYLGATVSGGYTQNHVRLGSLSCDVDSSGVNAGVFARDFDIGKIGIGYARARNHWCSYSTFSGNEDGGIDTETTSANASYYFQDITVGAAYSDSRVIQGRWGQDSSATSVSAKYYPMSSLSAGLSVSRSRTDGTHQDTPYLAFEYQPEIFGNSTSLTLGLSHNEYSNSATLGITYFFDKRVDLITRDRRYR
jgi:hypothetical protein